MHAILSPTFFGRSDETATQFLFADSMNMITPQTNPYSSPSSSNPQVGVSVKASMLTIVLVATLTAIGSFLSYLLVAFMSELVLISLFGRWEPLSQIVPHSDTVMVAAAAFMGGLFLARFKRVPRKTWTVPFGTFAAWTTYLMLSPAPIRLRLAFALAFATLTTLGFRLMDAASVRFKPTNSIDVRRGENLT